LAGQVRLFVWPDHLTTHQLDLFDGAFNPAEMWQVPTGVL